MSTVLSTSFEMKVPFYDVDSFRLVWHGNYPKYFEIARCQLLDMIAYPYSKMESSGYFYPVIDLQVKYVQPIIFEQDIVVSAALKEWRDKLVINYAIHDRDTGQRLTKAQTTQIAVQMPGNITLFQAPQEMLTAVDTAIKKYSSK